MKVINLFAGPCAGKSTLASGIFYELKKERLNVEITSEFAKAVTWEGHTNLFKDQIFMLANQNRKLERLRDKVDYAITDSPLLMNINYAPEDYLAGSFEAVVKELSNTYQNINFFIERLSNEYDEKGRNESKEEALKKDLEIKNLLDDTNTPYISIPYNLEIPKIIFLIKQLSK